MKKFVRTLGLLTATSVLTAGMAFAADATAPAGGAAPKAPKMAGHKGMKKGHKKGMKKGAKKGMKKMEKKGMEKKS